MYAVSFWIGMLTLYPPPPPPRNLLFEVDGRGEGEGPGPEGPEAPPGGRAAPRGGGDSALWDGRTCTHGKGM